MKVNILFKISRFLTLKLLLLKSLYIFIFICTYVCPFISSFVGDAFVCVNLKFLVNILYFKIYLFPACSNVHKYLFICVRVCKYLYWGRFFLFQVLNFFCLNLSSACIRMHVCFWSLIRYIIIILNIYIIMYVCIYLH